MGCGASAEAKAAPNIVQYFNCVQKMVDSTAKVDPMEMLCDPAKMKAVQQKAEGLKVDCIGWAGKSFDHHDKDSNQHLDVAEAKVLFQDYVTLFLDFHDKSDVKLIKTQMAMASKAMEPMMRMIAGDSMRRQEQEAIEQIKTSLKGKRDNYNKNKVSCDAKGFAVLDINGDGKVYKKDMVAALTMDTDMYNNVHEALGLLDPIELAVKQQAAAMQGQMSELPADCPQM